MPACGDGSSCKDMSLPLDGHHACGLCEVELHEICSCFYNEESIKYQNTCFLCKVALDHKNYELKLYGYPTLPFPMTLQEAAELLPEILQRQQPDPLAEIAWSLQPDPPPVGECSPLHPCQLAS